MEKVKQNWRKNFQVFTKGEVMPQWSGKWKYNSYAKEYSRYADFEISTSTLLECFKCPERIKKQIKGTRSVFAWNNLKSGKKPLQHYAWGILK